MHAAPGCLVVAVHTRKELDAALDEAVDLLKPAAMAEHVGISVARLAPGVDRLSGWLSRGGHSSLILPM